jgi:hypothetical protein
MFVIFRNGMCSKNSDMSLLEINSHLATDTAAEVAKIMEINQIKNFFNFLNYLNFEVFIRNAGIT